MTLSAQADALFDLIAAIDAPMSAKAVQTFARRAEWAHPSGKAWTQARVREALGELVEAERVFETDEKRRYVFDRAFSGERIIALAERGALEAIRDAAREQFPLPTGWRNFHQIEETLHAITVHLRLSLHLGDEAGYRDALEATERLGVGRRGPDPDDLRRLEQGALMDCDPAVAETDVDLLGRVPFATSRHGLETTIYDLAARGEDTGPHLRVCAARPIQEWTPDLVGAVAFAELLRGDGTRAVAVVDEAAGATGGITPVAAATRGLSQWWIGEDAGIDATWTAIRAERELLHDKKATLTPELDLLFVAALLSRGRSADLKRASAYGKVLAAQRVDGMNHGAIALAAVAQKRSGSSGLPQLHAIPRLAAQLAWWDLLGVLLAARWSGRALTDAERERALGFADLVSAGPGSWLAEQLRAIADPAAELAAERPLVARAETHRPWEDALGALERLAKKHGGAAKASGEEGVPVGAERLVFDVHVGGHVTIQPMLQKRNKRGWTGGRRAAIKTLHQRPPKGADEHDRRVLSTIKMMRRESHWGYPEIEYDFGPGALAALVGHPRVRFMGESSFVPVISEEVAIVASAEGDQFRVELDPPVLDEAARVDDVGRLVIVTPTKAQRELGKALEAQRMVFPAAARGRLAEVLAGLASIAPVRADGLGLEVAAASVDALVVPHARLVRDEMGLQMTFRVLPLGPEGPSAIPGAGTEVLVARRGGESVQTKRDLEAERAAMDALLEACPHIARAARAPHRPRELGGGAYEAPLYFESLASSLDAVAELRAAGDLVQAEWPEGEPLHVLTVHREQVVTRVESRRDWLEARGEVKVDGERVASLQELLAELRTKPGRFVRLSDGRFLALERTLAKELAQLAALADTKTNKKGETKARLSPVAAIALAGLEGPLGISTDEALRQRLATVRRTQAEPAPIPRTLEATLRPYQEDGFRWLAQLGELGLGACLADDMGLGKTVQTIALLLHRAQRGPAFVSAPTSVCAGWHEELTRFAPTLTLRELRGADAVEDLGELGPFDVVVASHGVLTRDAERLGAIRFANRGAGRGAGVQERGHANARRRRSRSTRRCAWPPRARRSRTTSASSTRSSASSSRASSAPPPRSSASSRISSRSRTTAARASGSRRASGPSSSGAPSPRCSTSSRRARTCSSESRRARSSASSTRPCGARPRRTSSRPAISGWARARATRGSRSSPRSRASAKRAATRTSSRPS